MAFAWISALLILGLFGVTIAILRAASAPRRRMDAANRAAPLLTASAFVVDKRSQVGGNEYGSVTAYFVTFELEDRQRIEIPVTGGASGQMVIGDRGILTWQGTQFHSFQREVLR